MKTFFTADHHFYHANIIKFVKRPYESSGHMNEDMITKWNQTITNDDQVFYLGDFTLGSVEQARSIFARLNGKIYFVPGGHDKRWIKGLKKEVMYTGMFTEQHWPITFMDTLFDRKFQVGGDTERLTLCHYPMYSWEASHYGALHLHGHTHGTIGWVTPSGDKQLPPGETNGLRVDIGVDNWGFYPVTLDQILTRLKSEGYDQ